MTAYIHHIETLNPPYRYRQDFARDQMRHWLPGTRAARWINRLYDRSGIQTRYSVLPDFTAGEAPVLFRENADGTRVSPTTAARNRVYARWAETLGVAVSRNALAGCDGVGRDDVTHLITASCTGFSNPGMDLHIVQGLGIPAGVERYQLGFMGCYAAFPALRMASQFCQARPDAVVLVVCLELCSLHLQISSEPDNLLANALFADGAAAAIVSARQPAAGRPVLALESFASALAPEGAGDLAWSIGDQGFDIRLSTYVPDILAGNIQAMVETVLAPSPWTRGDIGLWAVHPGGRAILDKIERALALRPEQVADSRAVLSAYGNMSSATMLFVLRRMLLRRDASGAAAPLFAMAFGPGITVESALLRRVLLRSERKTPAGHPHADLADA